VHVKPAIRRSTPAGKRPGWPTSFATPKQHPDAILPDLSKPDPLVTFRKDEIAFVYGSKWKQRYFKRVGDDYFVFPAQWDVTHQIWRPYFVKNGTDLVRDEFLFSSRRTQIFTTRSRVFRQERERVPAFSLLRRTRSMSRRDDKDPMGRRYWITMSSTNACRAQLVLKLLCWFAIVTSISSLGMGQTASLHGQVFDQSGAV